MVVLNERLTAHYLYKVMKALIQCLRMLCVMIPIVIVGWILYPSTPPTCNDFILMAMMLVIWMDIRDIKDRK